jgi:aryl-alcohol dehydrogenase-like predicted oxidoreductase
MAFDFASLRQPILGLAHLKSPLRQNGRNSLAEFAFLDRAFDEGYRVMDTAAVYGLGQSEKGLGRWMKARGNRQQLTIITKGGHPRLLFPSRHRLTVAAIAEDLATSRRRLQTDYIDVYLLHRDAVACDLPAVMQCLHEEVVRGRIGAIGASNWHHTRIEEANRIARERGLTPLTISSPQLSLLSWNRPPWRGCVSISGADGASARRWYADARLPVLAWSPLGGGVVHSDTGGWMPKGSCYAVPENQIRLEGAAAVASRRGLSVPQVLIAYVVSLPGQAHPICGSRSIEHLRANREALSVRLSEEELETLEAS